MTAPQPPDWLRGDYDHAAWSAGYAAAAAHGGWHPVFASTLAVLASGAGRYCRLAAAQRVANAGDVAELTRLRVFIRRMMADWYLLPAGRVPLGEIRRDGLDADIAALCGVIAPDGGQGEVTDRGRDPARRSPPRSAGR